MSKLLSANMSRLIKNKFLWISLGTMFLLSVITMLLGCRRTVMLELEEKFFEPNYFQLVPIIALFLAFFLSMFLGT